MRITQGTFSFLPDLSDEQIARQIEYCLNNDWALGIEYTDDPHPRNTYWDMFGMPMFDLHDAAGIMAELANCRATFPNHYIRLTAFDSTQGTESIVLAFIVNRPQIEPGFRLVRREAEGRTVRYSIESYAVHAHPEGERYA
jgi:ribulose-bisphosphate carboxylase small chain